MGRNRQAHATLPRCGNAGERPVSPVWGKEIEAPSHPHTTPSLLVPCPSQLLPEAAHAAETPTSHLPPGVAPLLPFHRFRRPHAIVSCCTLNRLRDVCDLRRDAIHRPATEQAMQTDTSECPFQNLSRPVFDSPRARSKQFLMAPRRHPRRVRFLPCSAFD